MIVALDDMAIDHGTNPNPDAPCPECGGDDDVMRRPAVGIAVMDGARLCNPCLDELIPGLSQVLNIVTDLQWALEESEHPEALAVCSRGLLKAATQVLLYDADWTATKARRTIRALPDTG